MSVSEANETGETGEMTGRSGRVDGVKVRPERVALSGVSGGVPGAVTVTASGVSGPDRPDVPGGMTVIGTEEGTGSGFVAQVMMCILPDPERVRSMAERYPSSSESGERPQALWAIAPCVAI